MSDTFEDRRFGTVDAKAEVIEAEIEFAGDLIFVEVEVEEGPIEPESLEVVHRFFDELDRHHAKARLRLTAESKLEGTAVRDFMLHHADESSIVAAFEGVRDWPRNPGAFLDDLRLDSVLICPGDGEDFATMDFVLGKDLSDYVLAVGVDQNGELREITMES